MANLRRVFLFAGIAAAILILAGCVDILKRECPSSCNDGNPCTDDYCGADTNYKCVNKPLSGSQPACSGSVSGAPCAIMACDSGTCVTKSVTNCCGNAECEYNEDTVSCPQDCKSSVELKCGTEGTFVPILLKLENELNKSFISCDVINKGEKPIEAILTAEIPEWSNQFSKTVFIAPNKSQNVDISLTYKDKFYSNTELADATVLFSVESSGTVLSKESRNIKIAPKDNIVWYYNANGKQLDLSYSVVAWVTPHDPCIKSLISIAKEIHPKKTLGGYAGYDGMSRQEKETNTLAQAQAIYEAIKGQGISYVNTPVSFLSSGQQVKLPSESLMQKSGNCVDGSVLFASVFEALGMNTIIAFISDHTWVGVESYPGSGQFMFIETTIVEEASFEEAVDAGRKEFEQNQFSGDFFIVPINKYRTRVKPFPSAVSTCQLKANCNDGTPAGQCSTQKPKMCIGNEFVDKAIVCGCPTGHVRVGDSCVSGKVRDETVSIQKGFAYYYGGDAATESVQIKYRYVVSSTEAVDIKVVPSQSDYNGILAGGAYDEYTACGAISNTFYNQTCTINQKGGIVILNNGVYEASVHLQVFVED